MVEEEMTACIFCQIINSEAPCYEDALFYGRFDIVPVSPGHMLLFPKRHLVRLLDLNQEEWTQLYTAIGAAVRLITTTDLQRIYQEMVAKPTLPNSVAFASKMLSHPSLGTIPTDFNHGVNDGRAAGRTVDHLHWHIIPRYAGDVPDPRGGVRVVIPENGNYAAQ